MIKKPLLRERLKEIDLRLVDLSELLKISRPTAYKFIELYEIGQRDKFDSKILRFFDYVCQNDINKMDAISFILNNISMPENQSNEDKKQQITNLLKKDNEVKVNFIEKLTQVDIFDPILSYLLECEKIITSNNRSKKKELSDDDDKKLEALKQFYNALGFKLNIKGEKNA
nr:hypothetical protein [uncultured Campylobacter sp.]